VVRLGAVRVTSPVRTAIDLLRTCEPFSASDAVDVLAVLQVGGADVSECRRRIRAQARFPGVRRALARAAALECSGPMPFLQAGAAVSRR
jgi:hypothetical protein